MKCLAIIFDVDGTLAETEDLHRAAFNSTFKKWSLDWYWDTDTYRELLKVSGGKERIIYYQNLIKCKRKGLDKKVASYSCLIAVSLIILLNKEASSAAFKTLSV